jgi:hypothetical protein
MLGLDYGNEQDKAQCKGMTNDDYFKHTTREHATRYVQDLLGRWFPLLKSSKKTVEVHLFKESPISRRVEHFLGYDLKGNIRVFLSSDLMEKLIDASNSEVQIPPNLILEPEFDLLMGLDFKMFQWRAFLFDEIPFRYSEQWMYWLWSARNQGIARFPSLQIRDDLMVKLTHTRFSLKKIMIKLVKQLEKGELQLGAFHHFLRNQKEEFDQIAPLLMLHATTVYCEKYPPVNLGDSLKKLRKFRYLCKQRDLMKVVIHGKKIDFDQWLEYLTLPTNDSPPMIQVDILRRLNQLLLSLDGKGSIIDVMLKEKTEDLYYFKFLHKRKKGLNFYLAGVRVEFDFSIKSRFHLLLETWS